MMNTGTYIRRKNMKRTPEFVLGLIGAILGIIIIGIDFVLLVFGSAGDSARLRSIPFFPIQFFALLFSLLGNHLSKKLFGSFMIITGLITLLSMSLLFVPAILYLISGVMTFRNLKTKNTFEL
jgi:hypothetical protein